MEELSMVRWGVRPGERVEVEITALGMLCRTTLAIDGEECPQIGSDPDVYEYIVPDDGAAGHFGVISLDYPSGATSSKRYRIAVQGDQPPTTEQIPGPTLGPPLKGHRRFVDITFEVK